MLGIGVLIEAGALGRVGGRVKTKGFAPGANEIGSFAEGQSPPGRARAAIWTWTG